MNADLPLANCTQKLRETVQSRHGSAEIFEIYSGSGRFIGFQVYRNGTPECAPFQTLKGAQVRASRPCAIYGFANNQIDRIRHCSVAGIIEMSVIAEVVIRSEPSGMIRIAHRSFQIDNPVKRFAGADCN
jgi:hypothetical protein